MTVYIVHATDGATAQVRDSSLAMAASAARAIALDGRVAVVRTGFETKHPAAYVRSVPPDEVNPKGWSVTGRGSFIEQLRQILEDHG